MGSVGIERGDGEVEQAVVVEILHDRAAGLVEAVDPDQVADVAELADVELGLEESIQRDQEPGIDLVRIFAQGHVGQVEQPADLEVVGELLEVLGEMPDRQPGALGIGVDGGRRDRQDARALAPALDAVLVLAAPQGGHPLEVDDGVAPERRPGRDRSSIQDRVCSSDSAGPAWLPFVVEQRSFHEERHDLLFIGPLLPGHVLVEPIDDSVSRSLEGVADLLERGGWRPGLEHWQDRGESTRVQREFLLVRHSRPMVATRNVGPTGIRHDGRGDHDPEQHQTDQEPHFLEPAF